MSGEDTLFFCHVKSRADVTDYWQGSPGGLGDTGFGIPVMNYIIKGEIVEM